jgi:hypothetical protein
MAAAGPIQGGQCGMALMEPVDLPPGRDRLAATVAYSASGHIGWHSQATVGGRSAQPGVQSRVSHDVSSYITSSTLKIGQGEEVFDRASQRERAERADSVFHPLGIILRNLFIVFELA